MKYRYEEENGKLLIKNMDELTEFEKIYRDGQRIIIIHNPKKRKPS